MTLEYVFPSNSKHWQLVIAKIYSSFSYDHTKGNLPKTEKIKWELLLVEYSREKQYILDDALLKPIFRPWYLHILAGGDFP